MFSWMKFIVYKLLPISNVTDEVLRSFRSLPIHFHRNIFKETLLKVVEIVEEKIREELRKSKSALMYDGWTRNSTHYVGLFALYNRVHTVYNHGCPNEIIAPRCVLLAVSPMAQPDTD